MELDLEADRSERVHLMLDVGRDRLGVAGTDLDFERRLARHRKTQPPLVHHDPPPRACGETVCTTQPARHGLLVPLGAEANETETVWELAPVARRTAEQSTEPGRPSVVVGHPISELERGTVTDMLAVTARKLGDPVACVVLVVAGDRSFHERQPTSGSSNIAGAHISRAPRGRPGGAGRLGAARPRATVGAADSITGPSTPGPASKQRSGEQHDLPARSLVGMLFTVGHGTLEIEQLTGLLVDAGIARLVDVRSFPGSRRLPHFGREEMAHSVPVAGVGYEWWPALGGRRKPQPRSANVAWRNPSFRAYADYMTSFPFLDALDQLVLDATSNDVAVMCSESVWWRCHRRLIADAAVLLRESEVWHLLHDGRLQAHPPTPGVRVDPSGILVYDVGATPRLPG